MQALPVIADHLRLSHRFSANQVLKLKVGNVRTRILQILKLFCLSKGLLPLELAFTSWFELSQKDTAKGHLLLRMRSKRWVKREEK